MTKFEKAECTAKFIKYLHPLCDLSTTKDEHGTQIHLKNVSQNLKKIINLDCITMFDSYFDISSISGTYSLDDIGIRFYWPTHSNWPTTVGFSVLPKEGIFRFSISGTHILNWDHVKKQFSIENADNVIYLQEHNKDNMALACGLNAFVNVMVNQHRNTYLER
ncbi:hypothetical protein phiOC_p366 [Ochrobactrum phage vB_OspM_OC]|nr:hypothetical protein phiOC_p366 [Ochrobactrum phage vB_OspM_OC]